MTDLARRLWDARRSGGVVGLDTCEHPKSSKEAYAIQDEIAALCGLPTQGFKVGSTSAEAQRILGTNEPGSGLLLARYVYESPASIAVVAAHTPAVEGEFALKLGLDLPPRAAPYTIAEVADAVAAVAGAIEVVGTRFSGGLAGKGRLLVTADCGANIALVNGPWRHDAKSLDLKTQPVAMTINGLVRGTGTGARALGDPMNVLLWLANEQSTRGRPESGRDRFDRHLHWPRSGAAGRSRAGRFRRSGNRRNFVRIGQSKRGQEPAPTNGARRFEEATAR